MPPITTDAGRVRLASPRALGRALVAPVLTLLLLLAFRDKLLSVDLAEMRGAFARIAPAAWLQAAALAGLGYWALGRFDAVAHRMFHTGVGQKLARRAGMAAMAISQTLGLGILTGALARWRMIPGLSPARALMLSTIMAAGFFAIWAWLSMAALMLHPELEPDTALAAHAGFWITTVLGAVLALWPAGLPRRLRRRLRSSGIGMRSVAALTFYAALDMLAAAGIMHVLLDGAAAVPLHVMVPVFLLSLGAGLMAGTPAGLGAFELTMLSLLPSTDPALLVAAITGYRLVYFAVPATLATIALAAPGLIRPKHGAIELEWRRGAEVGCAETELGRALADCALAEAHLARQPGLGLLWSASRGAGAVIGVAGHSLVMIRDPFPADAMAEVGEEFLNLARDRGLSPCHYKCGARMAVRARRRGHQVLQVAREAWLDPAQYDIGARSRRQLRRKLRHAEKEGLEFLPADPAALPLPQMARINAGWAEAHGGERGFSMGRFHPSILAHQRIYLAWQGTELRGFVSFHASAGEWTLDLMRPASDATDGTAHGLIHAALEDARAHGIPRLSLAAAPFEGGDADPEQADGPLARLQKRLAGRTGGLGLARFKAMFDPNWEPLYITAPSRWKLLRSGAEIARAIAHPEPFPDPRKGREPSRFRR
ncbi:phosphatidylglycerol lysyltransferase domain-containing protein [Mangrovicoccus sp. HB161399]|uniref:phosphatidylglycerol lysyltransferase domain-containing protein n=1 Tax=Mangrovicoccus sp. HB161399 TaxID=2720392 RepID=UPI0015553293|nr:phosphatidylglycerol lysyltransferase domain-containing protein [Mangrovicoccus sp. HB161399]